LICFILSFRWIEVESECYNNTCYEYIASSESSESWETDCANGYETNKCIILEDDCIQIPDDYCTNKGINIIINIDRHIYIYIRFYIRFVYLFKGMTLQLAILTHIVNL
jgi:hypothetical protein